MEEEQIAQDTKPYYLLGALVLIAVVVAGYFLRPKAMAPKSDAPATDAAAVPTPTPGPITGLACDTQYYNPVVGFEKYYLSVEGGDVSEAKKVDCEFTATVDGKVVGTDKVSSPLTEKPQRGGSTFRCTTDGMELKSNVPTRVSIVLKDDLKATATCSADFIFPAP